jgi:tetratricopeptide (TPR) repeat protein
MHSLIRLYAAEQARQHTSTEDALRRLVDYYLHTAFLGDRALQPHRPPIDLTPAVDVSFTEKEALDWFETEYDCLVAALRFAVERDWHTQVWQLSWSLTSYQWRQGLVHDELAAWSAGLVAARALGDPVVEALALRRLGYTFGKTGATSEGLCYLHEAPRLARALGHSSDDLPHIWLAMASAHTNDHERAIEYGRKALQAFQCNGRRVLEATARNLLGLRYAYLGDHEMARELTLGALAINHELGITDSDANSLYPLGHAAQGHS